MTESFTGTGVALVTPFQSDGKVDFAALGRIVDHVIEGGVEFIVVLGTTGESATLNKEEKKQVIEGIKKASAGRVPLVLGIGSYNTAEVLEGIEHTDLNGISGILSVVPYYNKPTQQGIYQHFSAIAKASPLPLLLYNVPGRTVANINADTVLKLAGQFRNIVGIKEASGNFKQIMQLVKYKPAHFEVLSGDDMLTLPMIHIGCKGVISVIANSHPRQFSDMVRAALKRDVETANKLHYQLTELMIAYFEEGNPAGVKAAVEKLGLCGDMVRLPLVPASEALKDKIGKLMHEV